MSLYDDLQAYLQRTTNPEQPNLIRAAKAILSTSACTGSVSSSAKLKRQNEEKLLVAWADHKNHWIKPPEQDFYIAEGAEQKVFFIPHNQTVVKLNAGIFYEYWQDYLSSLLLHNFFFPSTGYKLLGFTRIDDQLHAVVEQSFVRSNQVTDLNQVREFLIDNGFKNTRNHDYYHPELKIILEDLHDENVLTYDEVLFFVDTVFYMNR